MGESLLSTYIGAGAAIIAALISGMAIIVDRRARQREAAHRRRLVRALRDVIAFYRLEELYTSQIAELTSSTPDVVKRDFRKSLREMGGRSPSQDATPLKAGERLLELGVDADGTDE